MSVTHTLEIPKQKPANKPRSAFLALSSAFSTVAADGFLLASSCFPCLRRAAETVPFGLMNVYMFMLMGRTWGLIFPRTDAYTVRSERDEIHVSVLTEHVQPSTLFSHTCLSVCVLLKAC